MLENYSKEKIKELIEITLALEWLGIHIEDTKELKDEYGFPSKLCYLFSVPESSDIDVEDAELQEKVKTSDGLISIAKEQMMDTVNSLYKGTFGDEEDLFFGDVKDDMSDYVKFYAKVRTGEKWNKEMGDAAVKKLTNEIYAVSGYKEV
jgi:hypothetical protein